MPIELEQRLLRFEADKNKYDKTNKADNTDILNILHPAMLSSKPYQTLKALVKVDVHLQTLKQVEDQHLKQETGDYRANQMVSLLQELKENKNDTHRNLQKEILKEFPNIYTDLKQGLIPTEINRIKNIVERHLQDLNAALESTMNQAQRANMEALHAAEERIRQRRQVTHERKAQEKLDKKAVKEAKSPITQEPAAQTREATARLAKQIEHPKSTQATRVKQVSALVIETSPLEEIATRPRRK